MPLVETVPFNGRPSPLLKGQSLFDVHQTGLCCVQYVNSRCQLTTGRLPGLGDREKDNDRYGVNGMQDSVVLVRRALLKRRQRVVCKQNAAVRVTAL